MKTEQPEGSYLPIFPVMDSLKDCVDFAEFKLPITEKNVLLCILSMYQNTLLKVVQKQCPNCRTGEVPSCK
jgi:hypothetical protein